MATTPTSSGNSTGSGSESGRITNSGSEPDLGAVMDQRKRRRMESNRESARRSRMRKQKHLGDLRDQVDRLRVENNQMMTSVSIATQQFLNVEAENSVLRAQTMELSNRLDSLNEILGYMNAASGVVFGGDEQCFNNDGFMMMNGDNINNNCNNSWNMTYVNQPIMANNDMFQF